MPLHADRIRQINSEIALVEHDIAAAEAMNAGRRLKLASLLRKRDTLLKQLDQMHPARMEAEIDAVDRFLDDAQGLNRFLGIQL